jgi:monofunctional biosynthetic peptidoglycan transglycosylase
MARILKRLLANSFSFFLISLVLSGGSVLFFLGWIYFTLPSKSEILGCIVTKMFEVNLCASDSKYIPYRNIPNHLIDILILSEDESFWTHNGFDLEEIKKSIEGNLVAGRYKRGASTISQQLAKNMFLTKDKTLIRKFKEALITHRLEQYLSKREIIEKYLNIVEFGPKIYGVGPASWFYFGKSPRELTPEESAFLVMLLPNPKKYSQSFFQKRLTPYAFSRINTLLKRAYVTGKISSEQYDQSRFRAQYLFNSNIPGWDETEVPSIDPDEESNLDEDLSSLDQSRPNVLEVQDQTSPND